MKGQEAKKPSAAPDFYQMTHLQVSAIKKLTLAIAEPRPFECTICGSFWPSNYSLTQHIRVHTGEKPFHCSYCQRSFRQKAILTNHEKMHRGERPNCCPHCPKTFVQPSKMREHIIRNHIERKLYHCPDCPEKFYNNTQVRYHRIRSHGVEHPHSCSHCEAKFLFQSHLNQHLCRIHGIVPYSCSKCGEKFQVLKDLLSHEGGHEVGGPKSLKVSTAKQTVKVPVSQPLQSSAKSGTNEQKVKSSISVAKFQGQQKENLGSKLIKTNKPSKVDVIEKREIESEDEISVVYEGKKQAGNLVEKEKLDKSRKGKELKTDDDFKNEVDSMTKSSPTNKIQTVETPADDQKDNSPFKKKYFCSCGNSYKSIDKFQRHQQRNEGHQDATVVTQQPPSSLIEVEESPKKKNKLEKVQVKNEKREEPQIEKSTKKRKRMQIKTEPENQSRIEEPSPKTRRKMLQLSANNDEMETEMCEESSKKMHHCVCGKSYKSVEKFQRHQQRNGHDNNAKVEEGGKQQSPSSQNSASCQQLTTKNQEVKEEYHRKVDAKSPVVENAKLSIKKKVQQFDVDTKDAEVVVVVKCERKQIKREKLDNGVDDIKVETAGLKIKTQDISFDGEGSKNKISKKIKLEKVAVEYKEKENKVNPSSKCEVQMNKIKTEKVNKDEKSIPNVELQGEKTLKVNKKKEIKTESSPTTSQLSTFNGVEKTKKRINEDIKVESQEDEIEIVEIKLNKKQDEKNVEEKCSCGKLFSSPEKFQRHRERKGHHISKTYKCFCSSLVFNSLEEFRSHLWENHRS